MPYDFDYWLKKLDEEPTSANYQTACLEVIKAGLRGEISLREQQRFTATLEKNFKKYVRAGMKKYPTGSS
jgi:hypothetical protein